MWESSDWRFLEVCAWVGLITIGAALFGGFVAAVYFLCRWIF